MAFGYAIAASAPAPSQGRVVFLVILDLSCAVCIFHRGRALNTDGEIRKCLVALLVSIFRGEV